MRLQNLVQRWLRGLAYRSWRRSLDAGLAEAMRVIADQEQRAGSVAADMLLVALDRRRSAEFSLERWSRLTSRARSDRPGVSQAEQSGDS